MTSLQDQLKQFQILIEQHQIDQKLVQKSLFFLESGSNDVFNYFIPFNTPTLSPDAYVEAMLIEVKHFVDQIYKLGARRVAIFSLGPVGCVPARALLPGAPVDRCFGKMNKMVKNYNFGLENLVKDIPNKYPGAAGAYGLIYNMVQLLRATPTRYGNLISSLFVDIFNFHYTIFKNYSVFFFPSPCVEQCTLYSCESTWFNFS